jgi:hypothetical protein
MRDANATISSRADLSRSTFVNEDMRVRICFRCGCPCHHTLIDGASEISVLLDGGSVTNTSSSNSPERVGAEETVALLSTVGAGVSSSATIGAGETDGASVSVAFVAAVVGASESSWPSVGAGDAVSPSTTGDAVGELVSVAFGSTVGMSLSPSPSDGASDMEGLGEIPGDTEGPSEPPGVSVAF